MRKLLLITGALLLSVGPAVAQTSTTDYPPTTGSSTTAGPTSTTGATSTTGPTSSTIAPGSTTSTTAAGPRIVTIQHGKLAEGSTQTFESCSFSEDPSVFFNTSLVDDSDEIDAAGCAKQTVRVIEDGEPDGSALGRPAVAAIGVPLQLAQANPTPVVEIDGQRFAARGDGRDNVLQNVGFGRDGRELIVRHIFSLGEPGEGGRRGALARTGATIVRWSLPGAALVGVGALLVLAARRRRATA